MGVRVGLILFLMKRLLTVVYMWVSMSRSQAEFLQQQEEVLLCSHWSQLVSWVVSWALSGVVSGVVLVNAGCERWSRVPQDVAPLHPPPPEADVCFQLFSLIPLCRLTCHSIYFFLQHFTYS